MPIQRVGPDIFKDSIQLSLVANNALVIVTLPDGRAWSSAKPVDAPCGERLEGANDLRKSMLPTNLT
jgi:hypothetical protein